MSYSDKGEVTREFYRKQGEVRERERILKIISDLSRTGRLYPESLELMIRESRIERGQAAINDLPS